MKLIWILLAVFAVTSNVKAKFSTQNKVTPQFVLQSHKLPGVDATSSTFRWDTQAKYQWSEDWGLRWDLGLYHRLNSQSNHEQWKMNYRELHIVHSKYPWRMRAGYSTYNWGTVDGFSPLNVINQSQYFDVLSPEKLGALAIDLKYEFPWGDLQLVYLPQRGFAQLPATDSPWLPRKVLVNVSSANFTVNLPEELRYSYSEPTVFDGVDQSNFATKLSFNSGSIDFGLVFFEGMTHQPQISPTIELVVTSIGPPTQFAAKPDIKLAPTYHRQRVAGLNSVWASDNFIVRFEGANTSNLTESSDAPSWQWQSALSIESQTTVFNNNLRVLLNHYYGKSQGKEDNFISSNYQIFNEATSLGFIYDLQNLTYLNLVALYHYPTTANYWQLGYSHSWSKYKFQLKYEWINGPDDSLLGTFRDGDRALGNMTYFF